MAISNTRLTTTTPTTVYSSSGNNAITTIVVCNTGVVDLTDETVNACELTMYFVPNLGSAGDGTTVVKSLIVPAGETVFFSDEKVILSTGDFISAQASVEDLLTVTVSSLPV
jgi:hypothetical protein